MKEKVCIIGAGKIGQTIGEIFKKQGYEIEFWDKDISKIPDQKPLAETLCSVDFLFLCVPSWAMRKVMSDVVSYLNKKAIVISLAKGIEQSTNKTIDEVLKEFLPRNRLAILGGPMLAKELKDGLGGVGVVGINDKKIGKKILQIFDETNIRIECLSDMHGVALTGVLKNIYAIGLGIADGLSYSGNNKGWLVTLALKEMAEIIQLLGGKKETAYSTAGLGDLIATGYSPYSRNREVGVELVKTGTCCLESEGSRSLSGIATRLGVKKTRFPLFVALENILIKNQDVKTTFQGLYKKI